MADVVTGRASSGPSPGADLFTRVTPLVQRQAEEEEPVQAQAEEDKEEEPVQAQAEEEEEEPVQAQAEGEEEEPVQAQAEGEEEESVQAQAEEDKEEEPVQAQAEEEEPVQASADAGLTADASVDSVQDQLRAAEGGGSPLAADVRTRMEAQFGADFSGVRIHTDAVAVQLTRLLKAKAFTHGRDIYFNDSKYAPSTRSGEHLLAHELTHTIQQDAVTRQEVRPGTESTQIQRKEDEETVLVRPELIEAVRRARAEIGKVNAKKTDSDNTRIGWERLHEYFFTAFGNKEVIHKDVIKFIRSFKGQDALPSWCGIFVWWAYKQAGVPIPDWKLGASVLGVVQPRAPGELPRKGDIAYREKHQHFALVTGIEGAAEREGKNVKSVRVATINGNTSGQDNLGGQIEEKWEPIGRWLAFFDPVAKLDMPEMPLVETGVEPDEMVAATKPEAPAAALEPTPEAPLTDVERLQEEIVTEPDAADSETSSVEVELPEPPAIAEEEIAAPEAAALEGTSDEAMVAFVDASPSQMAATQPVLGEKLDGKINQEKKEEAENAPTLVAKTSGEVEQGLTPPDQIAIPADAQLGEGLSEADPGLLETKPHENLSETPSNERSERALDEHEKSEGFLDWLRNNISSFMSGIRTADPGLNTKAGERPNVALEGEANPERMGQQRGEANEQLRGQRDSVTEKLKNHPGQKNIQPKEVNEEKPTELSPDAAVKIDQPADTGVADYADARLPAEVRAKADDLLKPGLDANLAEARGQTEQAAHTKNEEKKAEVAKAQTETARINEEADRDQRNIVVTNRQDVARQQQEGIADAYAQVDEFNRDADTQQQDAQKEIGDKVKDSETKARQELDKGEQDAEKEKKEGEKEAEEKKRALEKEQENDSWWDRVKSAVKKAVKALTNAIDAIFNKIREAVKTIIEKAKNAAIGLINAARTWVVDKLNKFRDWAKNAVNTYLKDRFPGLAERINNGIDAVVDTAIDGVNAVADAAVAAVEKLANALAAALDKILSVYQTALKAAVQIAGAVLTGDFAEALRIAIRAACDIAGIDAQPIFDFIDRAAGLVTSILKEPGKFFNNVMKAIGGGVRNFVKNIKKHLIQGLIGWLTGALSEASITLPETFDFKGILSLVLQILGLTYENIKARIIKKYPPAATVFTVIEKTFEIIKRVVEEGPIALWEMIKENLSNLKEMVLSGIRDFVITTVVKEGITWLLGLLNPAGALVKLLKLIYDFVMFLVERFQQIKDFVMSVYNAISEIASGALTKAMTAVEDAMSRSLPVVISLLASLAGLGGIGKTIKKIIGKVTRPINKVIDKVIDKVIAFAKKLLKKGKAAAGKVKEKITALVYPKKSFEAGGETHTISLSESGEPMIASAPLPAEKFLANIEARDGDRLSASQKKHLAAAKSIIKSKVKPLAKRIEDQEKKDPAKAKPLLKEMLALEVELSNEIRLVLGTTSTFLDAKDKYMIEGMAGTYASLPKPKSDEFTPDHQPQNALFEWAAKQPYFKAGGNMDEHAKGRSRNAYAIHLHEIRHKDGRTFGSKGSEKKKEFVNRVSAIVPGKVTEQEKRDVVVREIGKDLKADVERMQSVVSKPASDPVWNDMNDLGVTSPEKDALIKDVKNQTKRGENIIAAQDLNRLKVG